MKKHITTLKSLIRRTLEERGKGKEDESVPRWEKDSFSLLKPLTEKYFLTWNYTVSLKIRGMD